MLALRKQGERVVGSYDGVEKRGLSDVREADDAGFEAHAYLG